MEIQPRQTAYKVWIANLVTGIYSKGQGEFDPGHVIIGDKLVSRVNLIAGVIDKFTGEGYMTLSLDDSSGIIRVKAWKDDTKLIQDVDIGDLVTVIGKVKTYNNEIFIAPEIIKKLDNPLWIKIRKQELIELYGTQKRIEAPKINKVIDEKPNTEELMEKVENENPNDKLGKIISLIESMDLGQGADMESVIQSSGLGDEAKIIITNMIKDGELFEVTKGKIKLM